MELYNWIFHSLRGKNKLRNTYFIRNPNERTKSIMWTLYNLQFSNNHHNIAVNVTLNLSPQRKIYSKSKTILQYSNKEKVPENPKRPQPFIHTLTVLSLIYTALTHRNVSYTQPKP